MFFLSVLLCFPGESHRAAESGGGLRNQGLAAGAPLVLLGGVGTGLAHFGGLRGGGDELQLLRVVWGRSRRVVLRLGRLVGHLLRLRLLLRRHLLAEVPGSFSAAPRVLMEVGRRLGTGAAVRSVMVVVVVVKLRGLLDVEVGVPQLSVLSDQVLHLAFELVDALALRLDQTLLVLHDGGELLQVEDGFHRVIQQALHHWDQTSCGCAQFLRLPSQLLLTLRSVDAAFRTEWIRDSVAAVWRVYTLLWGGQSHCLCVRVRARAFNEDARNGADARGGWASAECGGGVVVEQWRQHAAPIIKQNQRQVLLLTLDLSNL